MAKIITDKDKIDDILTRGVGEFIDPEGIFRKKLETNPRSIVIKFGVDPTRPDIHLGHAVVLHKLRQFQNMGCKVIFLVGDITAQIGDPTGKNKIRPEIDLKEIEKNMNTYLEQVDKILNTNQNVFDWTKNSDWFINVNDIIAPVRAIPLLKEYSINQYNKEELPSTDVYNRSAWWLETRKQKNTVINYTIITLLSILRHISHGRLIERDMFQKRIKNKEAIFMHEMLYPVIQGIDSDAIYDIYGSCDLEVGGTDQHFNMLVGREVMEMKKKPPQAVLSFKLLEGTDGKEKMSKSLDNYIGITDEPTDMYGKVMSIPDTSIGNYFELCTFTLMSEIEKIRENISNNKVNPKEIKMDLAKQIVFLYHGEKKAKEAQENWENTFSKKEIPTDIEEIKVNKGELLVDVLLNNKLVSSKSDFRRLVDEKAITNLDTDEKVTSHNEEVKDGVYRIGKKRFLKIKIVK